MDSDEAESDFEGDGTICPDDKRVFRGRINFDLDPSQFRERFRLSTSQAEALLLILGPHLAPKTTKTQAMPAKEKLLVALRFFAGDAEYYSVGDCHGVFVVLHFNLQAYSTVETREIPLIA